MTRLRRAIDEAARTLAQAGIDSAHVDAELLAAHVAGIDRGLLRFHDPDEAFFDGYRTVVDARSRRIPLQHLTAIGRLRAAGARSRTGRVHPASRDRVATGMGSAATTTRTTP